MRFNVFGRCEKNVHFSVNKKIDMKLNEHVFIPKKLNPS